MCCVDQLKVIAIVLYFVDVIKLLSLVVFYQFAVSACRKNLPSKAGKMRVNGTKTCLKWENMHVVGFSLFFSLFPAIKLQLFRKMITFFKQAKCICKSIVNAP